MALVRGYAATVWGAVALRFGLARPPQGSVAFFQYRQRWNLAARDAFGFDMCVDGPRPAPVGAGPGTLIVANHAGFADLNVLISETPPEAKLNFVAKIEAGEVPIFGWHLKHFGDLLLDRADPAARAELIERALARLEHGFSVGLFPEGTRSRDGRPKRTVHLALIEAAIRAGIAVQPVAISGTLGLIEDCRRRHHGHPIHVRFGRARRDYQDAKDVWSDVLRMWDEIANARQCALDLRPER
jgi:1-acyl-sn-glycerol-3-phosphate acyltransferase